METKHLQINDTLFPEKTLSRFIGTMNKAIGITGTNTAVNYLRHSKISMELLDFDKLSATEKVRLARLSFHSAWQHTQYLRKFDKL